MSLITALQRGLAILEAINRGYSQLRDIHAATKLPKSTIARMLDTLMAEGYVLQDRQKGYRVTARVLTLASGYDAANLLLEVARPVLEKLRQSHVWPSDLAVLDHDAMVILDTGRDPGTLSLNRTFGSRLPVLVTALGRAFLAHARPEIIERTITVLSQSDEPFAAPARDPKAVRRLLDRVRKQGYATGDREYLSTTRSVAVPILASGEVVASLNMMVVASAMDINQAAAQFVPIIREAAETIAANLSRAGRR